MFDFWRANNRDKSPNYSPHFEHNFTFLFWFVCASIIAQQFFVCFLSSFARAKNEALEAHKHSKCQLSSRLYFARVRFQYLISKLEI